MLINLLNKKTYEKKIYFLLRKNADNLLTSHKKINKKNRIQ